MKKILFSGSLALLLVPAFALAASPSDVTLDSNVGLNVGGITIDVTAAGATLNSITVGPSTFSVILGPGSHFNATAPNGNQLTSDNTSLQSYECDDSGSKLSITTTASTATTTITVTPSATICATATSGGGGSGGSGGSNGPIATGGSGGGGGSILPTQIGTPPIIQTTAPGTSTTIAALQAEVQALLGQIAALGGGTSFTRDLTIGSTGADVTALQVYLNTHGYVLASSGPGSPGNETAKFGALTRAALARFQKANGITPPAGYFGPKTRAYVAAHP
jgi:hypothetical protein